MKKELFSNVIGYENEKQTLRRIIDVLNNTEKYKKIGSSIPHGLLIYGKPGTGKTTLSKEFLKGINRKSFIVRKMKSDGSFIDYMKNIFEEAKKCQPSIILLDDMDKFSKSEEDSINQEEFVAVQSFIDEINDNHEEIFIFATVNDINVLPESLLRTGRFDIQIKINFPKDEDVYEIFKYYLKHKKIDKTINIKNISYILTGSTCSDLEKVCNQAGIYAAYKNKKIIGRDEIIRAALESQYDTNLEECERSTKYNLNTAYHEAGHALIGELLEPNTITFITIMNNDSDTNGFTKIQNNKNYFEDIKFMDNRVKILLAGKAATDIIYNTCDTGSNSDLTRVQIIVSRFVKDYCRYDFNSWFKDSNSTSEKVIQSKDNKVNEIITKYYNEVKELLIANREKLDKLAHTLNERKILFQDEIKEILK